MNRLLTIRQKEKEYHDECYESNALYEPGSWLHRPVKTVMELLPLFDDYDEVNVLDLGCGVGRNCIPIAQRFREKQGKIVGVDLLESAITKLNEYCKQYDVADKVEGILSDIAEYPIKDDQFDLIFSVSSIEHLDSEQSFDQVLDRMIQGTRAHGVNGIIISTGIKEAVIDTGEELDPMYELLFDTLTLIDKFELKYKGWKLLKHTVKPYAVDITRDGVNVQLASDVLTWVVQKSI